MEDARGVPGAWAMRDLHPNKRKKTVQKRTVTESPCFDGIGFNGKWNGMATGAHNACRHLALGMRPLRNSSQPLALVICHSPLRAGPCSKTGSPAPERLSRPRQCWRPLDCWLRLHRSGGGRGLTLTQQQAKAWLLRSPTKSPSSC